MISFNSLFVTWFVVFLFCLIFYQRTVILTAINNESVINKKASKI